MSLFRFTPDDPPAWSGRVGASGYGWPASSRSWALGAAAALLTVLAIAQQQVSFQQSAPPPAATVRYGQTALLPSEQRNVVARSGLLPSEMRDAYARSGALPSQGVTANAGTVRYGSYNQAYNREVNNQANTSVRYASAPMPLPAPPAATRPASMPRPSVPSPTPATVRGTGPVGGGPISTYRPAVPAYSGCIRYGR